MFFLHQGTLVLYQLCLSLEDLAYFACFCWALETPNSWLEAPAARHVSWQRGYLDGFQLSVTDFGECKSATKKRHQPCLRHPSTGATSTSPSQVRLAPAAYSIQPTIGNLAAP